MEIQLVIKAPSPSIEDYVVNCNLDWSVHKLKQHLSEVYPNKPIVKDQKIIYSGRILHDDLQLRDVLRHEDEQSPQHTLHLVCNIKNSFSQAQASTSSQSWPNPSAQSQPDLTSQASATNNPQLQENVLRNRHHPQLQSSSIFQQAYSGMPQPIPAPGDPQMFAQQMYAYYFAQYMQSMNAAISASNYPSAPDPSSSFQPINNPNNLQNENAAQRPVNANMRLNPGQGAPAVEDNEELGNRDWLDNFFVCWRFLILFSIVYCYSTPGRLMIVIVLAIVAFLYHEGWFVRRPIIIPPANLHAGQRNQNNANPNAGNNADDSAQDNQNDGSIETEMQDGHEIETVMDGDDPPHAQNPDMANNNSAFSPFTFISAFFSSLIPEPPPPVIN